ncbi:MAG: DNA-processing protein DprA [Clostridia bacterium]|nr:DNA-processing protein DprA [Clostridia bacterium]
MKISDNAPYAIWMNQMLGYGNQCTKQLVMQFGSPRAVFDLTSDEIEHIQFLNKKQKSMLYNKNLEYAYSVIETCKEKRISVYCFGDEDYPDCLSVIYAPPMVLYEKGKHFDYDKIPAFAVVGTRYLTEYGRRTAFDFAKDLAKSGLLVVSGMADGCDAQAHLGALKAGKPTVAVLGTGVDVIYPKVNRELYEYIVDYGAVLSEYPPGTKATHYAFPQRNRIISALTMGTLVVEGDLDSGSLYTADHANNQGKDVFAIPNNIYAENSRGTNQLLKEFALMAICPSDIVERYVDRFPEYLYQEAKKHTVPHEKYLEFLKNLTDDQKLVVAELSHKPKYIDEIVRKTGMPAGKVNGILTILMLNDIVYMVPGNSYALKL